MSNVKTPNEGHCYEHSSSVLCKWLIFQGVNRNLTVTDESKSRILLNVTYRLESDEPLHNCWEPINITCLIGQQTHPFTADHPFVCNSEFYVYKTVLEDTLMY